MKYKVIACDVFLRMICYEAAKSKNTIDLEFTPLSAHENADKMRNDIQNIINETDSRDDYDAIILAYGLCGNGTRGLKSKKHKIVIPRAHDCCTIFLGSKKAFIDNFGEKLSSSWSSHGYYERENDYMRDTQTGTMLGLDKDYKELVSKYGEENAKYIYDTLNPKDENSEIIYIKIDEFEHLEALDEIKKKADENKKDLVVINGNKRIIEALIKGDWNKEDFLVVPPNKSIKALYDQKDIIYY